MLLISCHFNICINTPANSMMLPEAENGLLLNEQQIQDLREARNKLRLPKSLSALAIRSVTTHFARFVGAPDSPLTYLPNAVVQQLLSKIATNIKKGKTKDMPLSIILGLLLNPNVTGLDFTLFKDPYCNAARLCCYLTLHALKNCPNIREIKLPNVWNHDEIFNISCNPLLLESFKKSWKNLTTIISSKYIICTKDTMAALLENFPNIEVLAVSIHIPDGPCAQAMLHHLIHMKRLHTLNLLDVVVDDRRLYKSVIPEFIADVVGKVPSLQNFGSVYYRSNASKFIDLFGEKYPHKKCLVDKLSIKKGLQRKWPKNLSVKHLIINFYWHSMMSDTEFENLSTIECTLDLAVEYQLEQQIYKVLDCIGGLVKSLAITRMARRRMPRYSSVILERILTACPNLEHFKFVPPRSVIEDPNYSMSPAAFKNYKSFEIDVYRDWSSDSKVVLLQVFRKFLIGTEVCESLKLYHYDQLQALVQFAIEYPESLQQLRELHFMPHTYFLISTCDHINAVLLKYDKCFYELLTCCHKLERIFYYVFNVQNVKEGKQENRYDFTIKSIDPHFIKYYQI